MSFSEMNGRSSGTGKCAGIRLGKAKLRWVAVLLILLLLPGTGMTEKHRSMPEYQVITQKSRTVNTASGIITRTYPETVNDIVNHDLRLLVDSMTEKGMTLLAREKKNAKNILDVGAEVTRTGTSWASFLVIARVVSAREQVGVVFTTRTYDIQTGRQIMLADLFEEYEFVTPMLEGAIWEQTAAYFPDDEVNTTSAGRLYNREALYSAEFTLGAARLAIHFRADDLYPGRNTMMHVYLNYTDLRPFMTRKAYEQTNNSSYKLLALTYDDGPALGSTHRLLNILREGCAEATFFITGTQIPGKHDVIARQSDAGHAVSSHGYNHEYLIRDREQLMERKEKMDKALTDITGHAPAYMRAPGGVEKPYLDYGIGLPLINWTLSAGDMRETTEDAVIDRVIHGAGDGYIVLMHDIKGFSANVSKSIIRSFSRRGYLLVTLDELFAARGIEMQPNIVYRDAKQK